MARFAVRALDPSTGDMTFGNGLGNFYVDSPQAVAQCIKTRLQLFRGEWYLNLDIGTPWMQQIMGKSAPAGRDAAIRQVILQTPFVAGLSNYSTFLDPRTRAWSVSCLVQTAFGAITIIVPFTAQPGQGPFQLGFSPLGGAQGLG